MVYRWKPKYAEVDPSNPSAWATCDRCGFVTQLSKLTWQYDYRGTVQLQNIRVLVCSRCYDAPQPGLSPYVLPPDPPPIYNARPEPYVLDETNWLTLEDGSILDTQEGADLITSLPNPATPPVVGADSIVEEAAVNITTESGEEIVTEAGDGNPLDYQPNPPP